MEEDVKMNLDELLKRFQKITSINFDACFIPIDKNTKNPLYSSVKELLIKRYQREYLIENDTIFLKDKNEKIMRIPNIKEKIKYNTRPTEISQDYKNIYERSMKSNNCMEEDNNININNTLNFDCDYIMKNSESSIDFSKKLVKLIDEEDEFQNLNIVNLNESSDMDC